MCIKVVHARAREAVEKLLPRAMISHTAPSITTCTDESDDDDDYDDNGDGDGDGDCDGDDDGDCDCGCEEVKSCMYS